MNLQEIYRLLYSKFGPQGWWPGTSSHEHFVGCILAQNTRWDRVKPVIGNLRRKGLLPPSEYLKLKSTDLEEVLQGSGTYRRKAQYLRNAGLYMLSIGWDGSPESVTEETSVLRNGLLSVRGIGEETCDCILLYVLERPVFVVDAYTRRILGRHGVCREKDSYKAIQSMFTQGLEADVEIFKEYHALLVECAKEFCRPVQKCLGCPLNERTQKC